MTIIVLIIIHIDHQFTNTIKTLTTWTHLLAVLVSFFEHHGRREAVLVVEHLEFLEDYREDAQGVECLKRGKSEGSSSVEVETEDRVCVGRFQRTKVEVRIKNLE